MAGEHAVSGERIRVTGTVQGVGFRPMVWRLARECGIRGDVRNDAEGVLIRAWGTNAQRERFVRGLRAEAPPLARIDGIERQLMSPCQGLPHSFEIVSSDRGEARTAISADAATCAACLTETLDPGSRRYRYPFTNCTHCGPRLSIVRAIPYDRPNTSMAAFPLCDDCLREFDDPADRRFHAQAMACPVCGPKAWLEDGAGRRLSTDGDAITAVARLITAGEIVAIKGLGGFQLACDACNEEAVQRLRARKQRPHKALALLARDADMVRRYAHCDAGELALLTSSASPIVLLERRADGDAQALPDVIAPGSGRLGFMLPPTPLHHLLMRELSAPIVLTSGNRSDEPQCIDNAEVRGRLRGIADACLMHDRGIVNRLDDSVLQMAAGQPRMLRRARGYAPRPIALPPGFEEAPPLLAMGGELKNTFCLLRDGEAILSPHMGDLGDAETLRDYRHYMQLYAGLFDHRPACVAVDMHPDYHASREGLALAASKRLPMFEVQHHHAHVAACMAEHGLPLGGEAVLGVVLDGLGLGIGGQLWGGEFLLADYRDFRRLGHFRAVPLPGGERANVEPWRNALGHLWSLPDWPRLRQIHARLDILRFLRARPLSLLEDMLAKGVNSPPASSCGRLIDAVAAAVGICRERVSYEGQAAMELEALARPCFEDEAGNAYAHGMREGDGGLCLDWSPLWPALLRDLADRLPVEVIAARFHQALCAGVVAMVLRLSAERRRTVVLGGGVFQNRLLLERIGDELRRAGLTVLAPQRMPANDGGLSLGQAVIAAARVLPSRENRTPS